MHKICLDNKYKRKRGAKETSFTRELSTFPIETRTLVIMKVILYDSNGLINKSFERYCIVYLIVLFKKLFLIIKNTVM